MTLADFLDWDGDGHQGKLELVDGVVRAMSPASTTHGKIQSNLNVLIANHLKKSGRGCHVVTKLAVETRLRSDHNLRVPDLGVTCGTIESGQIFLPDPLLLIEVLSPGNANDTWENVRAYALIPTVLEILAVHSTRVQAEVMRKSDDGAWPENPEVIGKGQSVRLLSIAATVPMSEIYAGTHLA